ncbi:MAG: hypothetical protein VX589_11345 [Myxococcota bacterium]|nr:hypothetical protein [Myxococcota bacterium]
MSRTMGTRVLLVWLSLAGLSGCLSSETEDENASTPSTMSSDESETQAVGGMVASGRCMPVETDYPGADWSACISDDGDYQKINESVSSIARIASFEAIADLLWRRNEPPTPTEFVEARVEYTIMEGLDSRVARRYDPHLTKPDGVTCRDEGEEVLLMHPDYCVGPAKIQPLIIKSLVDGADGKEPTLNAARTEAALLWFLYVSTYKEAITCGAKAKDCDSSWAYYTGGQQKDGGLGISKYIRRIEQTTHARIFDGLLGLRCWRDKDTAEPADDNERHLQVAAQIDRGLDRGLVVILTDRLETWKNAVDLEKAKAWAFLEILGPVADRLLRARNPDLAETIARVWRSGGEGVDADVIIAQLNDLVPCP